MSASLADLIGTGAAPPQHAPTRGTHRTGAEKQERVSVPEISGDDVENRLAIVVTDASSRRALTLAKRLARAGHLVILGSSCARSGEQAAAALRDQGAAAFAAQLSLRNCASIQAFAETARYLAGSIDVLVHVQGPTVSHTVSGAAGSTPEADLNLLGAHHLAAHLIGPTSSAACQDLLFVTLDCSAAHTRPRVAAYSTFMQGLESWAALRKAELAQAKSAAIVFDGDQRQSLVKCGASALQQTLDSMLTTHRGLAAVQDATPPSDRGASVTAFRPSHTPLRGATAGHSAGATTPTPEHVAIAATNRPS